MSERAPGFGLFVCHVYQKAHLGPMIGNRSLTQAGETALSLHLLGGIHCRAPWLTGTERSFLSAAVHPSSLQRCQLCAVNPVLWTPAMGCGLQPCAWSQSGKKICPRTSPCPQIASVVTEKPVRATGNTSDGGYTL